MKCVTSKQNWSQDTYSSSYPLHSHYYSRIIVSYLPLNNKHLLNFHSITKYFMMRMDSSNKMCVQYCLALSTFARRNTMLSKFQNEHAKNNIQKPNVSKKWPLLTVKITILYNWYGFMVCCFMLISRIFSMVQIAHSINIKSRYIPLPFIQYVIGHISYLQFEHDTHFAK